MPHLLVAPVVTGHLIRLLNLKPMQNEVVQIIHHVVLTWASALLSHGRLRETVLGAPVLRMG